MMRKIVIFLSAYVLAVLATVFLADDARTQSSPTRTQAIANPIGKVVSATGNISIEHADAVVVQTSLPAKATETKVGDLVYKGDIVSTGADAAIGITFTDGTAFNL